MNTITSSLPASETAANGIDFTSINNVKVFKAGELCQWIYAFEGRRAVDADGAPDANSNYWSFDTNGSAAIAKEDMLLIDDTQICAASAWFDAIDMRHGVDGRYSVDRLIMHLQGPVEREDLILISYEMLPTFDLQTASHYHLDVNGWGVDSPLMREWLNEFWADLKARADIRSSHIFSENPLLNGTENVRYFTRVFEHVWVEAGPDTGTIGYYDMVLVDDSVWCYAPHWFCALGLSGGCSDRYSLRELALAVRNMQFE